jgi:antibiotic biosynthesis monooxygenase (ABM) superfamily enzyme
MPTSTIIPQLRLKNARAWAPRTPARWPIALLAFLAALLLRLAVHDMLGPRLPLVFFSLATILVHFF